MLLGYSVTQLATFDSVIIHTHIKRSEIHHVTDWFEMYVVSPVGARLSKPLHSDSRP